jgi:hypothetical protein
MDAREERDAHTDISVLLEAWEEYERIIETVGGPRMISSIDNTLHQASVVLKHVRPSLPQLHHLALTQMSLSDGGLLGLFLSAGYQYLPQTEIVYDLVNPQLPFLGYGLSGKHLIIDGVTGCYAGKAMSGSLTINGRVGDYSAERMIGTLVNNGAAGYSLGQSMIGHLTNNRIVGDHAGRWMYGVVENYGTMEDYPAEGIRGRFKNHGDIGFTFPRRSRQWNIPSNSRKQFLVDIANPDGLSYRDLNSRLEERYA